MGNTASACEHTGSSKAQVNETRDKRFEEIESLNKRPNIIPSSVPLDRIILEMD